MARMSLFRLASPLNAAPRSFIIRQFSAAPARGVDKAKKESLQDRESMNTEAGEYSKSGSDTGTAQHDDAAFNPDKTSPEEEMEAAGEGQTGNPLNVSPANQEISSSSSEGSGGAGKKPSGEGDKKSSSGGQ